MPTPVDESRWIEVTLGDYHGGGIRAGGTLWCWGDNRRGAVGAGSSLLGFTGVLPRRVGTDSDWVHVAALEGATCALKPVCLGAP